MGHFVATFILFFLASGALSRSLNQYNPTRSFKDTCAELDFDLKFNVHRKLHNFGHIHSCVCLSQVKAFVDTNDVCKKGAKAKGFEAVEHFLRHEIESHRQKKRCHYPRHASPAPASKCSDPCAFVCTDGFQPGHVANPQPKHKHKPTPTTCVCPRGRHVYNGRCVARPSHPSPSPYSRPHHHHHHSHHS